MARVTVEDCITKEENRFELVLLAAHRARALHNGEKSNIPKDNDNFLGSQGQGWCRFAR